MNIDLNGNIEFNGFKLYMGMPYEEFYKIIPNFKGNQYLTSSGELIGHVGFLDNEISGPKWEISLQVYLDRGLCAMHLKFIGEPFGEKWLGDEAELKRKEYHKDFLNELGLKQRNYEFGYIRCSLNKAGRTNIVNIVKPPK